MPDKITFSWSNYFRPTPSNMEAGAAAIRRVINIIAGTSLIVEANHWVTFGIILLGAILDEMKNFFARVSDDYDKKVSINIPPAVADKVEITENETKE